MIDAAERTLTRTSEHAPVLYLTPYPPARTGIADYARCFQTAMGTCAGWDLRVLPAEERVTGASLRDFWTVRRRVLRWREQGLLNEVALAHAEIGYKEHDEFYTLWWLRRLMPTLPYVVTVHDPPLVVAPSLYPLSLGLSGAPVRRALRLLDYTGVGTRCVRSVLEGATVIFVLTEQGAGALRATLPGHTGIRVLPHINFRQERPIRPRDRETDCPVSILFLGFWGPTKGIETLLGAVERLVAESTQPIQLRLGGGLEQNGGNRAYVETMMERIERSPARASIQVLGYVSDGDLDATFDAADIFVVPYTRATGFSASGTVCRAMASGLAVVASNFGTLRDELGDNAFGQLVPPGNSDALAETLLRLCAEPERRRQLGSRAQEHLFGEHSGESVARSVKNAYDSVCYNLSSR